MARSTEIDETAAKSSGQHLSSEAKWLDELAPVPDVKKVAQTADEPPEEAEAHAEPASVFEHIQATPDAELGPGLKSLKQLSGEFAAASEADRPALLQKMKPDFEAGVSQSDKDYEAAKLNYDSEAAKMRPQVAPAEDAMEAAQKGLNDFLGKPDIKPEERQRVLGLMNILDTEGNSDALNKAIRRDLESSHPGATKIYDDYQKAASAYLPLKEQQDALVKGLETAAAERIASRMLYGEVLNAGGDTARAQRMQLEVKALIMELPFNQIEQVEERAKKP